MFKVRSLLMLAGLILTTLTIGSNALATNHLIQIRQVMAGANGDSNIQFVEVRMCCFGQNSWANVTRLVFFNATGGVTGEFPITTNPHPSGGDNMSVLFATQAFANLTGAPVPNFIIPTGLLQPTSGKVCFKSPSPAGDPDPFQVNLCLSYGTFTGDTEGAGTPAPALPITGTQSLKRLDTFANFFGGPPDSNPGSNLNSHFALADAAPQNTSGVSKGFSPDLSIVKTHTGNFTPGVNGVYTITVQNGGIGSTATSGTITVADTLPTGLSFVSGTGTGWSCSAISQAVTCTNPNALAVGASSVITLTVGVTSAGGSNVTNTATVSNPGEHNPSNNSSSNPTAITTPCSVTPITFGQTLPGALSNADCIAPHKPGALADLFTFSGTAGQQVAIRMTASADTFLFLVNPNGTTTSNDDCPGAGLNSCIPSNAVTGGFFTLPSTGTFTIEATSFNSSATFSYNLTLSINGVDLSITKSHGGNFVVGTNGMYTINVLNGGSVATTGATTVTDTLPTGLGFVSGTGTGWSCSAVGQVVTCTHAGSIPAATSVMVDVVVSVAAAAAPSVINTASVSTTGDVNAANNTANDPTFVVGDNHLVQIRQVMTGANNNAAVQFVETRMSSATQSLWANRVKLVFFDAGGNQTGEFIVPGNPPGGTNRSVLFATQGFANLPGAPVPDFIFPSGLLQPGSGKVCFKNTADLSALAVSLCLSYGSFTGDTEGGGSPTPALPVAGARSLKRLVANSGDFGGPPTDNPGSNQNSHFAIADAVPENSGGPSAPMSFFADVPANIFARPHIQAMANAGITGGCGVGTYCPANNVTREQMSIFIIRAMGQTPVNPATGVFTDVPPASFPFSAGFMEKMKELNITAGCGANIFCPGNNVTREQMSIFIIRAMGLTPIDPATGVFTDVPPASFPFSAGFMEKMKELNITAGCGANTFCPGNNVTREQMAIFLQRAFSLPIPP